MPDIRGTRISIREGLVARASSPCRHGQDGRATFGNAVVGHPVDGTLEPVRNGTPAPLEACTDGAAVAGGDLLLTGPEVSALCSAGISNPIRNPIMGNMIQRRKISNGVTGWRKSEAIQREKSEEKGSKLFCPAVPS